MRKFLLLYLLMLLVSIGYSQTSLTYSQRIANYYTGYNSGSSGIFNQGTYQVGMYANSSGDKQSVYWRKFRTNADGTATSNRSLQIGDEFVVTLSCTRAYGQIGFALLASPATTTDWDDRYNNYALQVNLDGPAYAGLDPETWGNWYIRYSGGSTSASSLSGVSGTTFKNFTIAILLTASDRANISISDGTTTDNFYDVQLNSSDPITDYSIFLQDDWNGTHSQNVYWGLGADVTQHRLTATGAVSIGASDNSFEITEDITDGLEATSTSTVSTNSFTKTGTGKVTLSGNNSFSDNAIVSDGTLVVNGDFESSNTVTVYENATLEITHDISMNELNIDGDGSGEIDAAVTFEDLNIADGGVLDILAGSSVDITGATTNNHGDAGLILRSTATEQASLILASSDIEATIERYIVGHGDINDAGWHLISSPVDNFIIGGSDFEPVLGSDDLYYWSEEDYEWKNYYNESNVGGQFTNMTNGKGYLCAYSGTGVKVFDSNMPVTDITWPNLSYSGGGEDDDWHLLGNPFTSALSIGGGEYTEGGDWAVTNFSTPEIYDESDGNYYAVNLVGNIIPAMQGFFVQAQDASNSITIPTAARTHDHDHDWYKTDEIINPNSIQLNITNAQNEFKDMLLVGFSQEATNIYDYKLDSRKLTGAASAPQLYSVDEIGDKYCVNFLKEDQNSRVVDLMFRPGTSGEHNISIMYNNLELLDQVYLEDTFENQMIDLSSVGSYTFNAEVGDNENRFKLHFGATGINEIQKEALQAYVSGHQLYIVGEEGPAELNVFNLQGQQLLQEQIQLNAQYSRTLNLKSGIYLVSLRSQNETKTTKISIR